jgi:hypothetical protein
MQGNYLAITMGKNFSEKRNRFFDLYFALSNGDEFEVVRKNENLSNLLKKEYVDFFSALVPEFSREAYDSYMEKMAPVHEEGVTKFSYAYKDSLEQKIRANKNIVNQIKNLEGSDEMVDFDVHNLAFLACQAFDRFIQKYASSQQQNTYQ